MPLCTVWGLAPGRAAGRPVDARTALTAIIAIVGWLVARTGNETVGTVIIIGTGLGLVVVVGFTSWFDVPLDPLRSVPRTAWRVFLGVALLAAGLMLGALSIGHILLDVYDGWFERYVMGAYVAVVALGAFAHGVARLAPRRPGTVSSATTDAVP